MNTGQWMVRNGIDKWLKRHAPREEHTMDKNRITHVQVSWTPDGLWGTEDPADYDWRTLERRHEEILAAMLKEEYPDAEIEIVRGSQPTQINGRAGHAEVQVVSHIEGEAYQQWLDELGEED